MERREQCPYRLIVYPTQNNREFVCREHFSEREKCLMGEKYVGMILLEEGGTEIERNICPTNGLIPVRRVRIYTE